jgi:hypothetical protein
MREKPKAMLFASLAADSLALGVHWIYNTNVIDKKFGRVETNPYVQLTIQPKCSANSPITGIKP